MKLITQNVHYAIRSLIYFAQYPDRVVSVNELAKKLNMRKPFLRRILQILSRNKILKSLKGKDGGFILKMPPSRIQVISIMEIFQNKINIMEYLPERSICLYPNECKLMVEIKDIGKKLHNTLRSITIAALLKSLDRKYKKEP